MWCGVLLFDVMLAWPCSAHDGVAGLRSKQSPKTHGSSKTT